MKQILFCVLSIFFFLCSIASPISAENTTEDCLDATGTLSLATASTVADPVVPLAEETESSTSEAISSTLPKTEEGEESSQTSTSEAPETEVVEASETQTASSAEEAKPEVTEAATATEETKPEATESAAAEEAKPEVTETTADEEAKPVVEAADSTEEVESEVSQTNGTKEAESAETASSPKIDPVTIENILLEKQQNFQEVLVHQSQTRVYYSRDSSESRNFLEDLETVVRQSGLEYLSFIVHNTLRIDLKKINVVTQNGGQEVLLELPPIDSETKIAIEYVKGVLIFDELENFQSTLENRYNEEFLARYQDFAEKNAIQVLKGWMPKDIVQSILMKFKPFDEATEEAEE